MISKSYVRRIMVHILNNSIPPDIKPLKYYRRYLEGSNSPQTPSVDRLGRFEHNIPAAQMPKQVLRVGRFNIPLPLVNIAYFACTCFLVTSADRISVRIAGLTSQLIATVGFVGSNMNGAMYVPAWCFYFYFRDSAKWRRNMKRNRINFIILIHFFPTNVLRAVWNHKIFFVWIAS